MTYAIAIAHVWSKENKNFNSPIRQKTLLLFGYTRYLVTNLTRCSPPPSIQLPFLLGTPILGNPGTNYNSVIQRDTYLDWAHQVPVTHIDNGAGLWSTPFSRLLEKLSVFMLLPEFRNSHCGRNCTFVHSVVSWKPSKYSAVVLRWNLRWMKFYYYRLLPQVLRELENWKGSTGNGLALKFVMDEILLLSIITLSANGIRKLRKQHWRWSPEWLLLDKLLKKIWILMSNAWHLVNTSTNCLMISYWTWTIEWTSKIILRMMQFFPKTGQSSLNIVYTHNFAWWKD